MQIIDADGKTIQFEQPPRRIVSLVPAVTEILLEIGARDRVVGVTYHDTMPSAAYKKIVGGFFSPSFKKISELNPDVVVVSSLHKDIIDQCEVSSIPTLRLDLSTLPNSFEAMESLGRLVQCESEAKALRLKIEKQFEHIQNKLNGIAPSNRLRTIRLMGRNRIMTPGDDSFQNQLIAAAGGIPPQLGKTGPVVEVTLEEWQRFNPQVIYGCGGDNETAKQFFDKPGWKDVDAVRAGRIYYFPCNLTCRAGAHMGDFTAWLSARLYGDGFANSENLVLQNRVVSQTPLSLDLPYVKEAAVIHSQIYDFPHKSMLITFSEPMKIVSTLEGARENITTAGNHFFPAPCWYIAHDKGLEGLRSKVCNVLNRDPQKTAMLFTGADMDHLSVQKKSFRDMTAYALVTAGAKSNALRASADTGSYYEPGTINIVVVTNMELTPRAMNRAVIAATEAKSAALQDLDIRSSSTARINGATGTGTDNIIIVQGRGAPIDVSGGHSKMGELVSRAVYQGVREALFQQNGFTSGRNVLQRLHERKITVRRLLNQDDCPCGLKPHEFAAEMETLLLEPRYASFVEAAFAISDDFERGMVNDISSFKTWAHSMAEQIAHGPIDRQETLINADKLPTVLYVALNALANGVKHRQDRQPEQK